jgi:hypothetical protein
MGIRIGGLRAAFAFVGGFKKTQFNAEDAEDAEKSTAKFRIFACSAFSAIACF